MDLVFAEEKYSKSGQLEKVRQHFGKELLFFILIADVISQAMGAIIQTKETILLFGMNHNGARFFLERVGVLCLYQPGLSRFGQWNAFIFIILPLYATRADWKYS